MKFNPSIIGLLAIITLFYSCSVSNDVVTKGIIQKRKYNKGFHVNLKKKKDKLQGKEKNIALVNRERTKIEQKASNTIGNLPYNESSPRANSYIAVEEIHEQKKTTRYSTPKKIIANDHTMPPLASVAQVDSKLHNRAKKGAKTELSMKRSNTPPLETNTTPNSDKSQVVALVLVIVVGLLGIHRFYLGYYVIGIIQLITLGGCGLWALIDLILIVTGNLKPKGGEYSETLESFDY